MSHSAVALDHSESVWVHTTSGEMRIKPSRLVTAHRSRMRSSKTACCSLGLNVPADGIGPYLFWFFLPREGYTGGHHVLNDSDILGEVQTCNLHQSGCSECGPQSQKFLISEDALHLYLLLLQMEDVAHRCKIKQNCWIQILGWCQTWELYASEVTDAYSITTCKYGLRAVRYLVVFCVESKLLFGKISNPFSTQGKFCGIRCAPCLWKVLSRIPELQAFALALWNAPLLASIPAGTVFYEMWFSLFYQS